MTRIVYTNGCFDVLHVGHVRLLQYAKSLGDYLVVAINSDDSIRRLKGPGRPINTAADRMEVLSSLRWPDAICVFEEDTPKASIMRWKPSVLVKGPECRGQVVPGQDLVPEVVIPEWGLSHSTSEIARRIQEP